MKRNIYVTLFQTETNLSTDYPASIQSQTYVGPPAKRCFATGGPTVVLLLSSVSFNLYRRVGPDLDEREE